MTLHALTPHVMAALHAQAYDRLRPWNSDAFADILAGPGAILTGDDRCFALGRVIAGEAELLTIATHPNHRRRGLAQERLAAYHAAAISRGAVTSFLDVAKTNQAAQQLYVNAGYARVGIRKNYYHISEGYREDAHVFSIQLSGP